MRKSWKRLTGVIVVVVVVVVAAGVGAQVYPVKWEDDAAERAEVGVPQAAVTINSFYVRNKSFTCPEGPSCDLPGGLLTTMCDTGDAAVGGTAYAYQASATAYIGQASRSWGTPQPRGWQGMTKQVAGGQVLFVKVVCAEVS